MLRIAQQFAKIRNGASLDLVDRQRLLTPETVEAFGAVGWKAQPIEADVFDWLQEAPAVDVLVANLFLHHFQDAELLDLFGKLASKAKRVIVCEPRRLRFPRLAIVSLLLIGANAVTRHDGLLSIRAGFKGQELSALWPEKDGWELEEYEAGLGSHCFRAQRH